MANPKGLGGPAPEHEARFWSLIEAAWASLGPEVRQARQALLVRPAGSPVETSVVAGALPGFLDALASHCRRLPGAELASLDQVLEHRLWEIDRADVHAVTGGSDDGFLYARGFIVAMGREFYGSVVDTPQTAVPWTEREEMCYFFAQLYRDRFGDFLDTSSGISRESGSNLAGWAR